MLGVTLHGFLLAVLAMNSSNATQIRHVSPQVLPLGQRLSVNIMQEWLRGANRRLTEPQFDVVRGALSICSLPLYTRLVFQEVRACVCACARVYV